MAETRSADGDDGVDPTAPTQPEPGAVREKGQSIAAGDCLGRYTVRGLLGTGGMGEVYEAYDPELDRRVALKVLKAGLGGTSPTGRARFQREAQAMARLNHPNVVAVYDVGTYGERVFVAMELVTGPNLADWLARKQHTWRQVVDIFLQAGRGLEAAHAAAIVHRDFKPSNVILGADRVRVADFGLARAFGDSESGGEHAAAAGALPASGLLPTVLDRTLTQTGTALGTPAYMAPEQARGGLVTAQSDQFAFCVALAEALEGLRAPRFLSAIVARGRRSDPEARFPSMTALLPELSRDRQRTQRRVVIAVAALMLVATGFVARQKTAQSPCRRAATRWSGIWDAAARERVHAAFVATKLADAEDAFKRARTRLDDYAGHWSGMADDACRATRVEGRQSDTLMDARMACLERRRSVVNELVQLWSRGMDEKTVLTADEAARNLPPVSECGAAHVGGERSPDSSARDVVARVRRELDAVQAQILAHHWADARRAIERVRAEADATGWAPLRAEAAYVQGDVLAKMSNPAAGPALEAANRLAGEARDDRLAARALILLVKNLAVDAQKPEPALTTSSIAEGALARVGDEPGLRAELLTQRGDALMIANRHAEALAAMNEAQPIYLAAYGPNDARTVWNEEETARVIFFSGRHDEGRKRLQAVIERTGALFGPDDPMLASELNNLGYQAELDEDLATAERLFQQALMLKQRIAGPDAQWITSTMLNLADVESLRGELDKAEALARRIFEVRRRELGPDNHRLAEPLMLLGYVARRRGRFADARQLFEQAAEIDRLAFGPASGSYADRLVDLADVQDSTGDVAGALDQYRQARAINLAVHGERHPATLSLDSSIAEELASLGRCDEAQPFIDMAVTGLAAQPERTEYGAALAAQARCDLARGHAARAIPALMRAIAIEERVGEEAVRRGIYRFRLVQALWATGRRTEALAAARRAQKELSSNADGARDLADLRRWLQARGG